jgi:broad specificity phosphatase PhoE
MAHLYVSHPQVVIDPAVPVPRWGLSEIGRARTQVAAAKPWLRPIRRIIASDEQKAVETAEILAEALGLTVEVRPGLHEVDRSATGFLPSGAFEAAADRLFAHPERSDDGWERAVNAQARIVAAVTGAIGEAGDLPTVLVGHGGVGTLLWCHLRGTPISRAHDQPPNSGGNVYAFDLTPPRVVHPWRPFDADESPTDESP